MRTAVPASVDHDIHDHRILVLDFGGQYTQLIARRVREANVYCEIRPFDVSIESVESFAPRGIILSGGPESVTAAKNVVAPPQLFSLGIPLLGICYGMQTMAAQLGGIVESAAQREYGYAQVRARGHSRLLQDIQDEINDAGHGLLDVWMSHGDRVTGLPRGFKVIASTDSAPIAGMGDDARGFLWHPVSPGGHAHCPGRGNHPAIRPRDLRLPRNVDAAQYY